MNTNRFIKMMLVNMLLFFLSLTNICKAQKATVHLKNLAFKDSSTRSVQIPFQLVNNLMVIPVRVNNSDTLHFIFDSGVSYIILSDQETAKQLNLSTRKIRRIKINGFGEKGDVSAFHSWGNKVDLKGIEGLNQDVIYPSKDILNLSTNMGMKIHGLIGASIFNNFIVGIDYRRKVLTLYEKEYYSLKKRDRFKRKFESFTIDVKRNRSFLLTKIASKETNKEHSVSLLIDTGASHALSILESDHHPLKASIKAIRDHMGVGIGGDLYGKVNRLDYLNIGSFSLEGPIVKYPEKTSMSIGVTDTTRHGSLGGEVLRRFYVILDYHNKEILLKKNANYKEDFLYNYIGLEFTKPYPGLPLFQVSKVRGESPAGRAGIIEGDRLVKINGFITSTMSADEIRMLFRGRHGKKLSLHIENNKGESKKYYLTLEDPFKVAANEF
ncbi:aspartyl protease family protein [Flammeovirga kamogawensis]|uniref:Aspartyl protease family protein n=1 Tax=Flammeovirga kamogawensis TaxID=373891 RepID=A0ABX8GSX5_9BACT|nr:aspartyl protease family protein [Flammeovirga kamogawensis]MBB6462988.1 hypothetical protein [Flammeovirga kamogawensis]QWG06513.1 aspartyl protease family protein [Flammeovirga kamogawensis]TRX68341.1 hypothetical protein EO216_09425 [Flammeovirga kamogawensis]